MSNSYKHPIYKDGNDKYFKKLSNKKIRRYLKNLTKGFKSKTFFKKIECPWNICDWKCEPMNEESFKIAKRK